MRALLIGLVASVTLASTAMAASEAEHPKQMNWHFDGVFGSFDRNSVQRGLQVYREVCAACHGLERVAFRTLTDVGFSEAEVASLASEYTYEDGPNDDGDMFDRPGAASDKFPSPYANEKQARAMQNGAYPPDLSLIIKARPDGANYVYSLLTGYKDAPADAHIAEGQYYNPYFPGGGIGMSPPLMSEQVEYQDGTAASVEQMSTDVVNFLQWAAEPEMEDRKRMGVRVFFFLTVMTVLFYLAKKRIWARLEDH